MFVWIIIICEDEILEIYILYILFDVIYYEINLFFLNWYCKIEVKYFVYLIFKI